MNKEKTFWTSDTHFGHANVIKYSNRPFANVEEMDEALISNWNKKVPKDGTVFFLGDFSFAKPERNLEILRRLNGNIQMIKGNHDSQKSFCKDGWNKFQTVRPLHEEYTDDRRLIVMCHFPLMSWNKMHYGSWMLHGHCHGNMKYPFDAKIYDVGVDNNSYFPVSFAELEEIMATKGQETLDHHES